MKFSTVVEQVLELLQRQRRISYRALKREFDLDDEYIDDLKAEIIDARRMAVDEDGKVLVWVGASPVSGSEFQVPSSTQPPAPSTQHPSAERRQLTVMFCDLAGSTALSALLDPEELREVVRAYHETCAAVISRYAGHTAQHLGDGLLVYFGYPAAHEDDAQRAARTGLKILAELPQLNRQLQPTVGATHASPLQLRIGLHTGLVVVGEIGGGGKRENLALGETPNIAARVQGEAEPNTVVLSAATYRLVQGLFECQDLGPHTLKGISTPLPLYRVVRESEIRSRFEVAVSTGLTPLVGREQEVGLLWERWERAKEGAGQVVLLSGEAGIGKSRLVQVLKERITTEPHTRLECRCSPYHQNSALYPVIDLLQRVLQFQRDDSSEEKLGKLARALELYGFAPLEVVPLFTSLLSLPLPERYPPLTITPQKQKEKTQHAIVTWLLKEAERQALLLVWEDLHWADPSTLELLDLLIGQTPTARMYMLLTFRPEFTPPWANRSHLTQLTLNRLPHKQVREMVSLVAVQTLRPSISSGRTESELGGEIFPVRAEPVEARTALSDDLIDAVIARTDGVPLFVEELTKAVLEAETDVGARHAVPLPLAIPATLHDSLMARLDRLGPVKEVAQLGATLGREFSYELLQAVSALDEGTLQRELARLVDAEFLFQRGLPPQARYVFKHALIQDAAYQSLLKSTRQQYHQQIAQVLEERFPETKETQPELVAHHYTEAGLSVQAIPYWQQAGQRANQRSANLEAISHLTKALELLKTLPDTPERAQRELTLQLALGAPLLATRGYSAPEVNRVYTRALELCRQMGETPQLFPVLLGLTGFRLVRGEFQTARELSEQLLRLAQSVQDPALLVPARNALGQSLYFLGEMAAAREHLEQGIAVYDPPTHHPLALLYGTDQGQHCLLFVAYVLWSLGYPDQALAEALDQVQKTGERTWEAELYRLKGELTLQRFNVQGSTFNVANPQSLAPDPQAGAEAEACFHKAIEIARRQQAKSLELRAVMSLSRLWQQQGKQHEARTMLAEIYDWFTEGFETKDLQGAKTLLEELAL